MRNLVALYISFNKLKSPPQLDPVKITLEILALTANKISSIDSGYFSGFEKLRTVHLNNNLLQAVPCLTSLHTSLEDLRLDYNRLKLVDGIYKSGTFIPLQRLTLSGNNIVSFNVSALLNMLNLSYLSLFKNNMMILSDPRPYFKGRMLGGNPWHCDPSTAWMPSMVMRRSKIFCESPPCLCGSDIKHMSDKNISQYLLVIFPWASYQIRKIAGCACTGNAGTVSPPPRVSDPDMHHGTCVTHVPWCMPGWLNSYFL